MRIAALAGTLAALIIPAAAVAAPAPPTGLHTQAATQTAVTWAWNPLPARPARYEVQYRRAGATTTYRSRTCGTCTRWTWTGLRAGTSYEARVRAVRIDHAATSWTRYIRGTTIAVPDPPAVLFTDDFNGPAGTPPDPARWTSFQGDNASQWNTSPPRTTNAFQDGAGNLTMQVRREPQGVPAPNGTQASYSGAFIGTFGYGTGWPPTDIKFTASVPYHVEMRALLPASPGLWAGLWPMSTDRTRADGIYELDVAEERLTLPTQAGCHQHLWTNGTDTPQFNGAATVSDMTRNWHTYRADVTGNVVDYWIDDIRCGTGPAPGVTGNQGILLDAKVGNPGSWGAAGGTPDPADPGPWNLLIDYIRVTR